ncbi:MAG: hypothetical protein RR382_00730 [Tannerellaceae bacterium]
MATFIFTFGSSENHAHPHCALPVEATDYETAREAMFAKYGSKWCSQYTSNQWQRLKGEAREKGRMIEKELPMVTTEQLFAEAGEEQPVRPIDANALKRADFQDFSNTDVMTAINEAPTLIFDITFEQAQAAAASMVESELAAHRKRLFESTCGECKSKIFIHVPCAQCPVELLKTLEGKNNEH